MEVEKVSWLCVCVCVYTNIHSCHLTSLDDIVHFPQIYVLKSTFSRFGVFFFCFFVVLHCSLTSKCLIIGTNFRYHVASGVVPGVQTKAREKTTKQRGARAFKGHALQPQNQSQNRKKRRRNSQKNSQLLRRRKRMKHQSRRQWQMKKINLSQSRFLNQLLQRKKLWQGRNLLEQQR